MTLNYSSYKTALHKAEATIKSLGMSETLAAAFKEADRVVMMLDKIDGRAIDGADAAKVTQVMKLVEGKILTTAQNGPMPTEDAGKQALHAQTQAVAEFLKIAVAVRTLVEAAPSGKGKKPEAKADARTTGHKPPDDVEDWFKNKKLAAGLHEFAKKQNNAECFEGFRLLLTTPGIAEIAELLYVFGKGDYNLPGGKQYQHLGIKSKNSTAAVKVIQKDHKLNADLQKLLKIMRTEFGVTLKNDVITEFMKTAECAELLKQL